MGRMETKVEFLIKDFAEYVLTYWFLNSFFTALVFIHFKHFLKDSNQERDTNDLDSLLCYSATCTFETFE